MLTGKIIKTTVQEAGLEVRMETARQEDNLPSISSHAQFSIHGTIGEQTSKLKASQGKSEIYVIRIL